MFHRIFTKNHFEASSGFLSFLKFFHDLTGINCMIRYKSITWWSQVKTRAPLWRPSTFMSVILRHPSMDLKDQIRHLAQISNNLLRFKGVRVVIWYLSIPPHNNSRVVVRNLRILVYRSSLRLTITHLKVNLVTSHHQVVSLF